MQIRGVASSMSTPALVVAILWLPNCVSFSAREQRVSSAQVRSLLLLELTSHHEGQPTADDVSLKAANTQYKGMAGIVLIPELHAPAQFLRYQACSNLDASRCRSGHLAGLGPKFIPGDVAGNVVVNFQGCTTAGRSNPVCSALKVQYLKLGAVTHPRGLDLWQRHDALHQAIVAKAFAIPQLVSSYASELYQKTPHAPVFVLLANHLRMNPYALGEFLAGATLETYLRQVREFVTMNSTQSTWKPEGFALLSLGAIPVVLHELARFKSDMWDGENSVSFAGRVHSWLRMEPDTVESDLSSRVSLHEMLDSLLYLVESPDQTGPVQLVHKRFIDRLAQVIDDVLALRVQQSRLASLSTRSARSANAN